MAKDLASFQRQVRQLRNLVADKSTGHEKVSDEHRDLLARLGNVPEPARDEPRLLGLFSTNKFDSWLENWAREATLKLAENTPQNASTDTGPGAASSNGAAQPRSILKTAANYILGGSKGDTGESSTQPTRTTTHSASPQPATSKAATPQSAASQSAASQSASPQPAISKAATPQSAASQPATSQPAASQSASPQPATSKAATPQSAASQPATSQPAASQPAASQPAASQPAASQPATSQPATSSTQRAASQPATSTQGTTPHHYRPPSVQDADDEGTHTIQRTAGIAGDRAHHIRSNIFGMYRRDDALGGIHEEPTPHSGPNSPISIGSDSTPLLQRSPPFRSSASRSFTRPHAETPPSRSGATAARGDYTPPPTPGREANETDQNHEDDGSAFDPDRWEQENGVDEAGYVVRPPCFSSQPNTMPSKQEFPELWYEISDPIDAKRKWGLLKGKVRKNSLAFEVPSSQGSRFMLFPPGPYKYVSQIYSQKTGKQVQEVPYGDQADMFSLDLAIAPPHQLCFSIGKGLEKKGDTFFIWYAPDEVWYTKSEMKECVGAAAVNAFLDQHVPVWNRPRKRPGSDRPPQEPLSPAPTPTQPPSALPRRQVHWPQSQRDRQEQRQTPSRHYQANAAPPGPLNQNAPAALHPSFDGISAANGAPPGWYNPPGHMNGPPPYAPGSPWNPSQPHQPSSNSQFPLGRGQAPWPYTFTYPQDPMNFDQPVHGALHWPWPPPYSQGYPQPPASHFQVPGGPPPYQTGSQRYRGSSHLPTPPRQMEDARPRQNGSRQASEPRNPGAGSQGYRRGSSTPSWWH